MAIVEAIDQANVRILDLDREKTAASFREGRCVVYLQLSSLTDRQWLTQFNKHYTRTPAAMRSHEAAVSGAAMLLADCEFSETAIQHVVNNAKDCIAKANASLAESKRAQTEQAAEMQRQKENQQQFIDSVLQKIRV